MLLHLHLHLHLRPRLRWVGFCTAAVVAGAPLLCFPLAPGVPANDTVAPLDATIPQIRGRGAPSPLVDRIVATRGAVTRVDSNGFFLQDPGGDGDPSTSDAVFVFTGTRPVLEAGQCVHVVGRVVEFDPLGVKGALAAAARRTVTELHVFAPPAVHGGPCEISAVALTLPLADGDDLSRLEGMLVTLSGPLTVQQNYFLGRFGQLTLAVGARTEVATNRLPPGPAARALAAADARRTVVLDDGSARQQPSPVPYLGEDGTVRVGDTTSRITGVIDFGPATPGATAAGAWKIQPTQPVHFTRTNPRLPAPAPVGGSLRIAAANVDNFFTTLADGTAGCFPRRLAADCRGARSALEFERQRAKLVEELLGLDADVVGLMEIENNGATALQALVDALNARLGRDTWARIADPARGSGGDAIKVALIYRPARVRPIGAARADTDPIHDRPPLAQTFETLSPQPRARITLIVDHFKSRRCEGASGADLDRGDGQGCWSHRRVLQAQALRRFAQDTQRRTGVADTLLLGDFNAYAREDAVALLLAHGFVDEIARFDPTGYTFVFDGAAGRLDEVLASPSLAPRVTGVSIWHVNADEPALLDYRRAFHAPGCPACAPDAYTASPWRASDHDPVLIGVRF